MHRAALVVASLVVAVSAFASADLSVDTYFTPQGYPGEVLPVSLNVHNDGPDTARNARTHVAVPAGAVVESTRTDDRALWTCANETDGVTCSAATLPPGFYSLLVKVRLPADSGDSVALFHADITAENEDGPNPNEFAYAVAVYRFTTVTSPADSGDGTLRAAMENANATCHAFCEIRFALDDDAVIEPVTPLPVITNCASLRIIGKPDTILFPGDGSLLIPIEPEPVEISGANLQSGNGLTFHSVCDEPLTFTLHTMQGLAIHDFPGNGVDVTGSRTNMQVVDCDLTDNMRGVRASVDFASIGVISCTVASNRGNGVEASGLLTLANSTLRANRANGVELRDGHVFSVQNILTRNGQAGYHLGRDATLGQIFADSVFANGTLAIDHEEETQPAPVIIAAIYDRSANVTHVRGTVDAGMTPPVELVIRVFSNGGYNASGHAEAERDELGFRPITISHPHAGANGWSVTLPRDLRGRIVSATAGVAPYENAFPTDVSEVSEGVQVR